MGKNLRPPAVPLITVDPYFNVWSMADNLYDDNTRHWTGKSNSMTGIIMVDGIPMLFMGRMNDGTSIKSMQQTSLKVEPLYTVYTFTGGGVELEVKFTAPLLPEDLKLMSRPVSYVEFSLVSIDGKAHDAYVYFDVSGELCVNTNDQKVECGKKDIRGIKALTMGSKEQNILGKTGDDLRIDWGYLYLAVPDSDEYTVFEGSEKTKEEFTSGNLKISCCSETCCQGETMPVLGTVINFGSINSGRISKLVVLAYDDIKSIEYFGSPLEGYWRIDGETIDEIIIKAFEEYRDISEKCIDFSKGMSEWACRAGGEKYKDILALSYRQAVAAHKLVFDNDKNVLFFSKENFSNGCIATVDVTYPSIPLFIIYNPELV
jgi:hypothetical protein